MTLSYAALLVAAAVAMALAGPDGRENWIRQSSTNLHNLGEGRIWTLVASAFVTEGSPIYEWLPGLVALLAVVELQWRSGRLLVALAAGHIGATLLVAAGLVTALGAGVVSGDVAYVTDVGMSYAAMGVLGAITAAIPLRWRAAWTGWWLAVAGGAAALAGGDFTSIGHAVALALGMVVSTRFGKPSGWTPVRYGLLALGSAFGYLVLVDADPSGLTATGGGVIGAVVADRLHRWFGNRRRRAATAGPAAVQG